jgi:hypothetical protein
VIEAGTPAGRRSRCPPLLPLHQLGQHLNLQLLLGHERLPLQRPQRIELLMQLPNLLLGAPVHLVVTARVASVFVALPVLTHHDDRRL